MRYKNLVTEEELRALLTPEEIEQVEWVQEDGDLSNVKGEAFASDERNREQSASPITVQRDQQAAKELPKIDDTFDRRTHTGDLMSMRVLELETRMEALALRVAILERRLARQSDRDEDDRIPERISTQDGANPIDVEARIGRERSPSQALAESQTHKETAAEGEAPLSRLETYSGRKHVKKKNWF